MDDEVLITIRASAPRRAFGLFVLVALAFLLLYLGIKSVDQSLGIKAFLVLIGLFSLYVAQRMWQATGAVLELTENALRTSDGEEVARMAEIVRLDRGTFAFKPSNGFILVLRKSRSARWRPGMWWRVNRRVGVGGVTSAGQAKAMAEIIAAKIAARED